MKNNLRSLTHFLLKSVGLFSLYSLRRSSALRDNGWFESFDEKTAVDSSGAPLPWFSYCAIDFIGKRINADMSVFEYGCGAGTRWWASRMKDVVACEHDFEWFQRVKQGLPSNVELICIDLEYGGAYSEKILDYSKRFDVIVIDGRDRANCAINSLPALKDDGIIVFDDSHRSQYSKAFNFLKDNGFHRIDFVGMGPGTIYNCSTAIFYRNDNIFKI